MTIRDVSRELKLDWHTVKTFRERIYARAASSKSCFSATDNRDRRNIFEKRTYLQDNCKRLREGSSYLVWWQGSVNWLGVNKINPSADGRAGGNGYVVPTSRDEKSTKKNIPSAAILYDKFHVMRHLLGRRNITDFPAMTVRILRDRNIHFCPIVKILLWMDVSR